MNNFLTFFFILMTILSTQADAKAQKKLPLCPHSPNCVSSQAPVNDKEHYIAPFNLISNPEDAWTALKNILNKQPRTVISKENEQDLEAQTTSLIFRFVDDIDIILNSEEKLIHIRSASRTGHSDLGVNRKRVEIIRQQLQKAGVIN